jgi:hypothetical protein
VGGSTALVIPGNKVAPGLADRFLARIGYQAQQFDGPPATGRGDNLNAPLDEARDFGAHGEFDGRAHGRSLELWASEHKGLLGALGAGAAAAAAALAAVVLTTR